jgi:hypothetical protein
MQVLVTGNEDGELEHAKSVRHLLPRPQMVFAAPDFQISGKGIGDTYG